MPRVQCAEHPDVDTDRACSACNKPICDTCAVYEIDDRVACESCGREAYARSRATGLSLFAVIAVGYLATLAVCVVVFRPRPWVGGLAAVVSIAIGRVLQLVLRPSVVNVRTG